MNKKYKLKTWVKVAIAVAIYLSLLIPILGVRKAVDRITDPDCIAYEEYMVCIHE